MKSNQTISIDAELLRKGKEAKINFSGICEKAIRTALFGSSGIENPVFDTEVQTLKLYYLKKNAYPTNGTLGQIFNKKLKEFAQKNNMPLNQALAYAEGK